MKKLFFILLFAGTGIIISGTSQAQVIYSTQWKSDADVKVYVSQWKSEADLVVYKTNWKSEATGNNSIWFFTEWKSDAPTGLFY